MFNKFMEKLLYLKPNCDIFATVVFYISKSVIYKSNVSY